VTTYTKILIAATALPVLNTRPAKSPLLILLRGGTKAAVYSKALSKIRSYPLLIKSRGYVTDNNKNSSGFNTPSQSQGPKGGGGTNLNDIDLNNIENISPPLETSQPSEGVPSLDDLFKFKEEIKKIREKKFDDLQESNTCPESAFSDSFGEKELKDWDIDELGFIYHSSSKENTSFDESFPNYQKERGELENSLNQVNSVNKILGNKRILELFKDRFNSEIPLDNNKSKEILNTVINDNPSEQATGFNFLKWNWKENNKLNIEVDLEKSRDVYNSTISVLKHLNLDTVDISGKVIPFTGWMLAHRTFMSTFHRHLNRNQANKSPQEILRFKKQNFRNLALIHVISLFVLVLLHLVLGMLLKIIQISLLLFLHLKGPVLWRKTWLQLF